MAGETQQKRLIYKAATHLQGKGNLQAQLKAALAKTSTVGTRKQVVNDGENTFLFINSHRARWNMLFGSMLLFSRGRNQPLVTENDAAEELTVEQLAPPPNKAGERRDFIESLLFYGIKGNHVVILQSAGLRARQFEMHLNWLLQTNTEVLDEDDRVMLSDHPSKKAMQKVLDSPVRRVKVGVDLESKARGAPVAAAKSSGVETTNLSFRPAGIGFDVLRSLLGADWFKKVRLDESLDESRLKVQVLVSYSRGTSDSGQELLNDIATQMRHQEPEDVTIELKNGTKLTGDELKISGPVSVLTYGGLVALEELFPKMRDWLAAQIEDGVVDP